MLSFEPKNITKFDIVQTKNATEINPYTTPDLMLELI